MHECNVVVRLGRLINFLLKLLTVSSLAMSVSHVCDEGWLISHEKFLIECYAGAGFMPKKEMFLINTPYMKEEQARKMYLSFDLDVQPVKKLKLDKSLNAVSSDQSENCFEVSFEIYSTDKFYSYCDK